MHGTGPDGPSFTAPPHGSFTWTGNAVGDHTTEPAAIQGPAPDGCKRLRGETELLCYEFFGVRRFSTGERRHRRKPMRPPKTRESRLWVDSGDAHFPPLFSTSEAVEEGVSGEATLRASHIYNLVSPCSLSVTGKVTAILALVWFSMPVPMNRENNSCGRSWSWPNLGTYTYKTEVPDFYRLPPIASAG